LNPEDEPQWYELPKLILEIVMECPFLFDLIKSESYDWEVNHRIYSEQEEQKSDCSMGIFNAILHEVSFLKS